MELEASQTPNEIIYVGEVGFNLAGSHWQRRNLIGKGATADALAQRRANMATCAAVPSGGLLLHKSQTWPNNTSKRNSYHSGRAATRDLSRGRNRVGQTSGHFVTS